MSHEPRYANGNERRKQRLRLKNEGRPCWICQAFGRSGVINYDLPPTHPYSFEVDELVPVSKYWLGGYATPTACALDYKNLAAAHRCCNLWRSNKTVDEVMRIARGRKGGKKPPVEIKTSRDWRNPKNGVEHEPRQED